MYVQNLESITKRLSQIVVRQNRSNRVNQFKTVF